MKRWISATAALVATAACLSAVPSGPATADVKGDIWMVGELPVSGTYNFPYKNYSERNQVCMEDGYCDFRGYRVSNGTLRVKLHTYQLDERIRDYAYFILDVDVENDDRGGTSNKGWAQIFIENVAAPGGRRVRLVDYADTRSISASEADCKTLGLSIGHSVGPASASLDWGSVKFCDDAASYVVDRTEGANRTVFMAHHAREIASFSSQRIVKVPRGKRPTFKVTVHVPSDDCTRVVGSQCRQYNNETNTFSYIIQTTG